MSYSGWIIAALAVVVFVYWTPALIKNRKNTIEMPVEDRFSRDLKLVSVAKEQPGLVVCCEEGRSQPRILPSAAVYRVEPNLADGSRSSKTGSIGGLSMADSHRTANEGYVSSTSREMAKLRASRAARLASENAAGKRRFALAGVSLTVLVAFVIAAIASPFAWGWVAVPAVLLASILAEGRLAYHRSVTRAKAENARIMELRESRGREQERYQRLRSGIEARIEAVESAPEASPIVEDEVEAEQPITQVESSEPWTPSLVPQSIFSKSKQTPHRSVVSIAEDDAEVQEPATSSHVRPVAARPMPLDSLTSEEAAELAETSFDLEDVLEHRRAQ